MNTNSLLKSTEASILIIEARAKKIIVIGVPHHAPFGTKELPCPEHRESDENTGFLGRYIAEALDCSSVIACNYTMDVNKCLRTDYAMQILKWSPNVLIEIHGHKGKENGGRANYDIEISSGSSDKNCHSKAMAAELSDIFTRTNKLKKLGMSISGDFSRIHFKASNSPTIVDDRWVSYHIELPPQLRKPQSKAKWKPPNIGYKFCDALMLVLKKLHGI